jgi:hypothetical protein
MSYLAKSASMRKNTHHEQLKPQTTQKLHHIHAQVHGDEKAGSSTSFWSFRPRKHSKPNSNDSKANTPHIHMTMYVHEGARWRESRAHTALANKTKKTKKPATTTMAVTHKQNYTHTHTYTHQNSTQEVAGTERRHTEESTGLVVEAAESRNESLWLARCQGARKLSRAKFLHPCLSFTPGCLA